MSSQNAIDQSLLDYRNDAVGNVQFGSGQGFDNGAAGCDDFDLVFIGFNGADAVQDDQVTKFSLQFGKRPKPRVFGFQGKPHGPLVWRLMVAQ